MTDSFDYHCNLCQNNETLNHEDTNWICICKKPQGSKWLHICSQCNFHHWGGRLETECVKCFVGKLNEKSIGISYKPIGDMVNVKRRDPNKDWDMAEKSNELLINAKKSAVLNKIAEQKAILDTPVLLKQVIERLDRILSERGEFEVV